MLLEEAGEHPAAPGARGLEGEAGWRLCFFQLHQFSLMKAITSPYQPYLAAELLQIAASPFGRQSRRGSRCKFAFSKDQMGQNCPFGSEIKALWGTQAIRLLCHASYPA